MMLNLFNSLKVKVLPFILISLVAFCFMDCKSEVSMEKQQKAFHVDAQGNLLNKKGNVVKKAGEFKLEGGYYVDGNGERIKRDIDKAKEKINEKMGQTKEKLSEKMGETKEKLSETKEKLGEKMGETKEKLGAAVGSTKEAVSDLTAKSTESVKANFNKLFNTKAVGTTYALSEIGFDKESHRITKMSKEEVVGLAEALKEHPESRIQVQVHTSDGQSKKECREISKLRADVVKNMLVTLGVGADQISSKGLGLTVEDAAKAVANTVEVVVEK
ncbi:MAG: OmpA family protein [Saprospiraceae bacterium]